MKFIAGLAVFWTMVQQIGAFMAGGYIAGRMRARWNETTQHEVEFRDGLHGGLVWAVGLVIGVAILMASAGAAARTGIETAGKAAALTASTTDPTGTVARYDAASRGCGPGNASKRAADRERLLRGRGPQVPPAQTIHGRRCPASLRARGEWFDVRPRPRVPCPDRRATDWRDAAGSREARQRSVHGCSRGSRQGQTRHHPGRLRDGGQPCHFFRRRLVGSPKGRAAPGQLGSGQIRIWQQNSPDEHAGRNLKAYPAGRRERPARTTASVRLNNSICCLRPGCAWDQRGALARSATIAKKRSEKALRFNMTKSSRMRSGCSCVTKFGSGQSWLCQHS